MYNSERKQMIYKNNRKGSAIFFLLAFMSLYLFSLMFASSKELSSYLFNQKKELNIKGIIIDNQEIASFEIK